MISYLLCWCRKPSSGTREGPRRAPAAAARSSGRVFHPRVFAPVKPIGAPGGLSLYCLHFYLHEAGTLFLLIRVGVLEPQNV